MKPDWEDAPEWANWLAMDENGQWVWFSEAPFPGHCIWRADEGEYQKAEPPKWKESLEPRPERKTKPR